MTEEQFWHSNPRIISVWGKAYKAARRNENAFIHSWIGNYGISALTVAIDHCFNGRKARSEYVKEPIELFEKTEEEKQQEVITARQAFMAWAESQKKQRKGGKDG